MIAQQTSLKIGPWHDRAVTARRLYHRAIVPTICAGLLCMAAISIVASLAASF